MKYLIMAVMMLISINSMAELTQEQQRQIQQIVEKSSSTKMIQPDDVEKWANLGSKIGVGLAATAKELGIAANEFANTTTGKVVIAIIIWQFLGGAIVHVIGGFIFMIGGLSLIWYVVFNTRRVDVEYDQSCKNIFGNHPVTSRIKHDIDSDHILVGAIFSIIAAVIGLIVILNF